MSASLTHGLRRVLNTPWGDRLKAALNVRPPKQVRPMADDATISDLFPWRVDDTWETRFDLMNLPALIDPERDADESAVIVCFDADGRELNRQAFSLRGLTFMPIQIEDLLLGQTGIGTFAVFHTAAGMADEIGVYGAYLTERNYLAVRRRGDPLWNYVHGNTYALSKAPTTEMLGHLSGHKKGPFRYRPQLRMDDCNRFELIYLNPLRTATMIEVELFDAHRQRIDVVADTIPSRGVRAFAFDNVERPVAMVEGRGVVEDWRPVIVKYHESHFDILHS